jgi:hypothetical protein
MSSRTCMQVDFEELSYLKLTLETENFIKEYVSFILLLSAISTVAIKRILT